MEEEQKQEWEKSMDKAFEAFHSTEGYKNGRNTDSYQSRSTSRKFQVRQPHSEETKQLQSTRARERERPDHLTDEHKEAISKALEGKGIAKEFSNEIECPHCGEKGKGPNFKGYHILRQECAKYEDKEVDCPNCGKTGNPAKNGQFRHWHLIDKKCKSMGTAIYGGSISTAKIYICPHCGKEGKGPAMMRHHFDKCKKRKNDH